MKNPIYEVKMRYIQGYPQTMLNLLTSLGQAMQSSKWQPLLKHLDSRRFVTDHPAPPKSFLDTVATTHLTP